MNSNTKPRPAVFLDRDGVIVKEIGYVTCREQIELYPFAARSIAALNRSGWLCVVVTNQSGVARGLMNEASLAGIHNALVEQLQVEHARLDAIYYCPHLPPAAGEREIPPYRINCACRKPNSGMIEKAVEQFNIDISRSFIIGDRETDIVSGFNAGLATVLVRTGYGVRGYKGEYGIEPDFIFNDLAEAAKFLIVKNAASPCLHHICI